MSTLEQPMWFVYMDGACSLTVMTGDENMALVDDPDLFGPWEDQADAAFAAIFAEHQLDAILRNILRNMETL